VQRGDQKQHENRRRTPSSGTIGRAIAGAGRIGLDSARCKSRLLECPVTVTSVEDLRAKIREVPDFPKPGILFYDITTLLKEPAAFREVIDRMAEQVAGMQIDVVVGMESRGFIFSAPLAYKLDAGFVPVRKLGKLPAETIEVEYELEYGTATLEIHRDAIQAGQHVLIVDDLLATGGTVIGTIELVRRLGGEIAGLSFMVELSGLHGRDKLREFEINALLTY
jgi:adenine phosphoribosyltransferase